MSNKNKFPEKVTDVQLQTRFEQTENAKRVVFLFRHQNFGPSTRE